ncbi:MAG TPA: hypothetical protein PKI14_12715 [Fervidobacterium sp.]|nr:hypothetical protein [Fervidobacterium sp.]
MREGTMRETDWYNLLDAVMKGKLRISNSFDLAVLLTLARRVTVQRQRLNGNQLLLVQNILRPYM